MPTSPPSPAAEELRAAISERELWYHTLELAPGVETPGWFDLRPIVDRLPWPDVEGKRCLDVGPWDGFLAFELERRGAREVVAADISSPADWDWPVATREKNIATFKGMGYDEPGGGLEIAKRMLGSSVERVEVNVYELSPETVGEFDVVVCGSLLLHLKDPVRALESIRSVCREAFLSAEQVNAGLTLLSRRRPLAQVRGGDRVQWWIPNAAGHRKLLAAGGFEVERATRPYSIPLGSGHPQRGRTGSLVGRAVTRLLTRGPGTGMAHVAALARPTGER